MSKFDWKNFRAFALASAMTLAAGQAQAQSSLQQVADEAALAAVQMLGNGAGPAEAATTVQQMVAAIPGTTLQVDASTADLVVNVRLSADQDSAISTARYLQPDQAPTWAWASKQRFALKHSPLVVGSTCVRGCDQAQ